MGVKNGLNHAYIICGQPLKLVAKWHRISEQYNPKIRYETGPGLAFDLIRPYSWSVMALFWLHQSIKWKGVGHF